MLLYAPLQKEEYGIPCSYINDPQCMMQMTYQCAFSVARKPLTGTREAAESSTCDPS